MPKSRTTAPSKRSKEARALRALPRKVIPNKKADRRQAQLDAEARKYLEEEDALVPTDAFNKWHPDKVAEFPAQAVDVIHYLQGALAQYRAADEGPSIDLAQAQRRWDEAADEIETLRAEVEQHKAMEAKYYPQDLRAEVERLKTARDGFYDDTVELRKQLIALRAENARLRGG